MPPDMYVLQCKGMLWRRDLNPSRFRQMNGRISATRLTLPLRKLVVLLTISVLPRSWSMPVSLSTTLRAESRNADLVDLLLCPCSIDPDPDDAHGADNDRCCIQIQPKPWRDVQNSGRHI
jgi:hypothetical protein